MTTTLHAASLALAACLALTACETSPLATGQPTSTLDVAVDAPPQRAAPTQATRAANPAPPPTEARVETLGAPPAPAATPAPAPDTTRRTNRPANDAPEKWWLLTPDPVPGRIRVIARAQAPTIVEARQAAVDAGRAQLIQLRGSAPPETEVEKAQAFRHGDTFEAFVLISCDR